MFRDVTGILDDAEAFQLTIEILANKFKDGGFTKIVGTEARGFLFGAPLALAMGLGFVPVRKPGKLPRATYAQDYQLEYGHDTLEIHQDALTKDDNVLIIDDLLATGGTIEATTKLIRRLGAKVTDAAFVISLPDLGGEVKIQDMGLSVFSLLQYAGE
jgi:adenine phosphoribosyltransferase